MADFISEIKLGGVHKYQGPFYYKHMLSSLLESLLLDVD